MGAPGNRAFWLAGLPSTNEATFLSGPCVAITGRGTRSKSEDLGAHPSLAASQAEASESSSVRHGS